MGMRTDQCECVRWLSPSITLLTKEPNTKKKIATTRSAPANKRWRESSNECVIPGRPCVRACMSVCVCVCVKKILNRISGRRELAETRAFCCFSHSLIVCAALHLFVEDSTDFIYLQFRTILCILCKWCPRVVHLAYLILIETKLCFLFSRNFDVSGRSQCISNATANKTMQDILVCAELNLIS